MPVRASTPRARQRPVQQPPQGLEGGARAPARAERMDEVVTALGGQEAVQRRVQGATEVRCGAGGEPLGPPGVDDHEAVGVVDVVGERLSRPPVQRRWRVLGDTLDVPPEESLDLVPPASGFSVSSSHEAPVRWPYAARRAGESRVGSTLNSTSCTFAALWSATRDSSTCSRFPVSRGQISVHSVRNGTTSTAFPRHDDSSTRCPCWSVKARSAIDGRDGTVLDDSQARRRWSRGARAARRHGQGEHASEQYHQPAAARSVAARPGVDHGSRVSPGVLTHASRCHHRIGSPPGESG